MQTQSTWRTFGVPCFLFLFVIYLALFLAPWMNPPTPQHFKYHLDKDAVVRALVASTSRTTGRSTFSIRPHHLEFSSTNGAVEVIVTVFDVKEPHQSVELMLDSTELVRLQKTPEKVIARATGQSGRIPLNTWPYGRISYVVYLRAEEASEVTLTANYGP